MGVKFCLLCNNEGHTLFFCPKYKIIERDENIDAEGGKDGYWQRRCEAAENLLAIADFPPNRPDTDNERFLIFRDRNDVWQKSKYPTPKEAASAVEEKPNMAKANAAQVLAGFLFKEANQLPKNVFSGSIEKGFEVDNTILLPYLMKFQEWIYKGQLAASPKEEVDAIGQDELFVMAHDKPTDLDRAVKEIERLEICLAEAEKEISRLNSIDNF